MKKFFEYLLTDEETGKQFTRQEIVTYGIILPLGLFLILCVAGWLETVMP